MHSLPDFQEARELLAWAKQIVFLGFGYHPSNMKRLEVADYEGKLAGGSSPSHRAVSTFSLSAWAFAWHSFGCL